MLLLITQRFTIIREDKIKAAEEKAKIEEKINERALTVYVDSKDKELKDEISKKSDELRVYVDRTVISFGNDVRELRNYFFSLHSTNRNKIINHLKSNITKDTIKSIPTIKPIEYARIGECALNNVKIN
jgi:hypothetical protein